VLLIQEAYEGLLGTEDVNKWHGSRNNKVHICKQSEVIHVHIMIACNVFAGHLKVLLCSRGDGECPSWSSYVLRFRLLYCADRLSLGLSSFLSSYTPLLRTDYDFS
jgi:hypothetical protein